MTTFNTNTVPDLESLPVIDMTSLFGSDVQARSVTAAEIGHACRQFGFFYTRGHRIPLDLLDRLDKISRQFFSLPIEEKMESDMQKGGGSWKGYFPLLGELTSGRPDLKEGIYFGTEVTGENLKNKFGVPLRTSNLFPTQPTEMKEIILEYMEAVTRAGHALLEGISLSLGLEADYFKNNYTENPTVTLGIFNYPSLEGVRVEEGKDEEGRWGTGEHTDYGLLTLLYQDQVGGLQVKTGNQWIEAPPIPDTIVCNICDMLDRLTRGVYHSTPHRVKVNQSGQGRLSFSLFFDPGFDLKVSPLPERVHQGLRTIGIEEDRQTRWDQASAYDVKGTYGDYMLDKLSRIFKHLK